MFLFKLGYKGKREEGRNGRVEGEREGKKSLSLSPASDGTLEETGRKGGGKILAREILLQTTNFTFK